MRRETTKVTFRVLSDDVPDDVADTIKNWIDSELRGREISERDTEITIIIGLE